MFQDDEKLEMLEHAVKESTEAANEAERKYDEVCCCCCMRDTWQRTGRQLLSASPLLLFPVVVLRNLVQCRWMLKGSCLPLC